MPSPHRTNRLSFSLWLVELPRNSDSEKLAHFWKKRSSKLQVSLPLRLGWAAFYWTAQRLQIFWSGIRHYRATPMNPP